MSVRPCTVVVMGVSGCGKTTLGRALAAALGWPFIEGDDHHSEANRAKMASGQPLENEDRQAWIAALTGAMRAAGPVSVAACSALNPVVRGWIEAGIGAPPVYLLLDGERNVLADRLARRPGHFMPPGLLDSQLAALDPPADAALIPISLPLEAQVDLALKEIRKRMEA